MEVLVRKVSYLKKLKLRDNFINYAKVEFNVISKANDLRSLAFVIN